MSTTWFHKPESALKRANELIAIGNKDGALELLQGVFAARRYKQWQKAYETLMIKFLDLCVELQRHREAKDGLHQYRNMAQQQAPGSLEVIITHLLDMSEGRATNAKMKANAISAEEVTQIGDLEAEASPESIMLSTMTEEGGKERTDREVVVPWLKFLWEAYRAVLDILKTNTKLEHVYHNTCIKAFNFCRTYARTTEFRRLCDTLRQHISNLQRHTGAAAATRLRGWEGWTSEGIELHLQTRFAQLEVAANLELWTEGFRTVEDIYNIMQIGKKVPKARLMASYYEKLTRIFLVSENHLFHAYAWYKYYTLSREYNKALTAEERTQQACCVLLAALAIPEVKARSAGGDGGAAYNDDDLTKEKNQRMATLLGFNTDPSRSALLQELVAKGLLAQVPPPLRLLYAQLEVSSSPLSIVKATAPAFEFLRAEANAAVLGVYCAQLERMVVLRMLEGLASIYQTVSLAKFKGYLAGLEMDFQEVEKLVVRAAKSKDIQVAVDYQVQCLRFTPAVMETEGMRSQLTSLARQLNDVVTLIGGFDAKGITDAGAIIVKEADSAAARHSFFAKVSSHVETEHAAALRRKEVIEKRKEEAERREQEKAREAARLKAEEEARRREEEASRLAREAKLREREKLQRMEDELALAETKNVLKELGKKVENLETMDKAAREIAIKTAKDEILTEKEKEEKRMKDQAKRMDYIVRAMRMEEAPVLQQKFAAQQEADQADHARRVEEYRVKHRLEWEESIKQKAALAKMQSYRSAFEAQVLQDRRAGFEQEVRRAEEAARERHRQNKIDRAARRKQQAEDDEIAAREAEAQRLREEEEERERKAAEDKKVEQDRAAAAAAKEAAAARRAPDEDGWQQARGGARGGDDREVRFGGAESRDGPAPSRADTASTWRRGGGGGGSGFDDRGGGGAARGGFEERGGGGGRFEERGGGGGGGGGRALEERFGGGRGGFEERGGGPRDMDGGRGGGFEDRGGRGGLDERRGPPPADSERSWRRSGPPAAGPPAAGPPGKEDGGSGPPAGQRPRWGMGRSLADLEKSGL